MPRARIQTPVVVSKRTAKLKGAYGIDEEKNESSNIRRRRQAARECPIESERELQKSMQSIVTLKNSQPSGPKEKVNRAFLSQCECIR